VIWGECNGRHTSGLHRITKSR